jgi:flagellar biosynthesis protein FlhF
MKIKSYFAGTVEAAIKQAKQELGEDAMLMNSRKSMPEARHLGEYEVVFASTTSPEPVNAPAAAPFKAEPRTETRFELKPEPRPEPRVSFQLPVMQPDRLAEEIADLRKQMERMASMFNRGTAVASSNLLASPVLARLFSSLIANDIHSDVAQDIVSGLRARGDIGKSDAARRGLCEEIASRCRTEATLGRSPGTRRIVAVIGPPGAGKTTSLVKLAVTYGLGARRPTQLLTFDLERIAAADQLHTFAAILGVGFQTLEMTPNALSLALEEHRSKDLILIDTPGYGPKDMENAVALAANFAKHPEIDIHLVLSASMKPADLSAVVDRFAIFQPHKLLFTRLDETQTFGSILNETSRTGKPVSFLCGGQQIPDDLEAATEHRVADLLIGEIVGRTTAAAA